MLISLNNIKKYTTLPELSYKEMAWKLTEASCEVEHITSSAEHLKQIFCIEISAIKKHPEADNLNLVSFTHQDQTIEVVCGAPNVAVGLKVPYAILGTTLPNGIKLEEKKIRGVLSRGMLCSEAELGLSHNHDGLLVLNDSFKVGDSLEQLLPNSDTLFEIDNKSITNRSDLWGFYGMAREFSALFNQPFTAKFNDTYKNSFIDSLPNTPSPLKIQLEPSACKAFYLLVIKNVQAVPSPAWLQTELKNLGLRPINALVDISNYVMLELGIPNHFYDLATLKGDKLIIKRASSNAKFTTLDGKERLLQDSDTIICDSDKILGLAGIMGGEATMVSETTTAIAIEVALWKADEIRKTSSRLGCRTDASIRYEKSLDGEMLLCAMARIAQLIKEIYPAASIITQMASSNLEPFTPYQVAFSLERFNRIMGLNLSLAEAKAILNCLGFTTSNESQTSLMVSPPSFRSTKERMAECDIFEEVGRIYGYSKISMASPMWQLNVAKLPPAIELERKIQDFCVLNANMMEIFTHPMTGEEALQLASWPLIGTPLKVANSVSSEHSQMRPSLLPSFLAVAELNQKNTHRFSCFEYGRAFLSDTKNFASDRYCLAMAFYDKTENRFLEAYNHVANLLKYLNLHHSQIELGLKNTTLHQTTWPALHPKEQASITINNLACGMLSTIHPHFSKKYKIKGNLVLLEIDFTHVINTYHLAKTNYKPLSKYPTSQFDCTILVGQNEEVGQIINSLNSSNIAFLESTKIVDIFTMSDKTRAITISNQLASSSKTLSSEELKSSESAIVSHINKLGYNIK